MSTGTNHGGFSHDSMKFKKQNEGKSGSARVCYVDFVVQEVIYLITVYSKNEKENLSQAERNGIKSLIEHVKLKL